MSELTINQILAEVQQNLHAPKNQYNGFGKYNYRNCEDIVEAVKPLLAPHGATLVISDTMVQVGERYYVRAMAAVILGEGADNAVHAVAYAREPESQKGMNEAQLTGSTSSYARKYALNGLFAIDDTKDADSQDNSEPQHRFKAGEKDKIITQVKECLEMGDENGLKEVLDEYSEPEEKIKVWALFTSAERSSIKSLLES